MGCSNLGLPECLANTLLLELLSVPSHDFHFHSLIFWMVHRVFCRKKWMVLENSIVWSLIFLWVYNLTPRITHKFLVEEKQKKRKEERHPMNSSSNSYEYNLMSAEKRSLQCSTAIAAIRLLLMSRELQQAREARKSNHFTFCHDSHPECPPWRLLHFTFLQLFQFEIYLSIFSGVQIKIHILNKHKYSMVDEQGLDTVLINMWGRGLEKNMLQQQDS